MARVPVSSGTKTAVMSSGGLTAEFLQAAGVPASAIGAILAATPASRVSSRKAPVERKTPDGLVGCRQGLMTIMGALKDKGNQRFTGQTELLSAIYNLVNCASSDGPLKAATPILALFCEQSELYVAWQEVSTGRAELNLKRGQDKPYFLGQIGLFIASAIKVLAANGSTLLVNGQSIQDLARHELNELVRQFRSLFVLPTVGVAGGKSGSGSSEPLRDSSIKGSLGGSCAATTQKGTSCQKTAKQSLHGAQYCTQHYNLLLKSA